MVSTVSVPRYGRTGCAGRKLPGGAVERFIIVPRPPTVGRVIGSPDQAPLYRLLGINRGLLGRDLSLCRCRRRWWGLRRRSDLGRRLRRRGGLIWRRTRLLGEHLHLHRQGRRLYIKGDSGFFQGTVLAQPSQAACQAGKDHKGQAGSQDK